MKNSGFPYKTSYGKTTPPPFPPCGRPWYLIYILFESIISAIVNIRSENCAYFWLTQYKRGCSDPPTFQQHDLWQQYGTTLSSSFSAIETRLLRPKLLEEGSADPTKIKIQPNQAWIPWYKLFAQKIGAFKWFEFWRYIWICRGYNLLLIISRNSFSSSYI